MSEELKTEFIDIDTKFKNMKSVDDLDFDDLKNMGRGQTPEGIEQKCLDLCKDYLGGNWGQQTVDSIQVKRITGGLMNQIYHCSIREPNEREGIPQEVTVKLYGKHIFGGPDRTRITDMITALIFSEKNLGPKIYGMFEEGVIQKYYKHRSFIGEDQKNPKILRQVIKTMAQIHALELPIKKQPLITFEKMTNSVKEGYDKYPINDLIEEYKCETLKKYDLKTELNWIKGVRERIKSPLVFIHGDFRSSNLMITEPNDELVVCDYDLCGYGYRGTEFSWLMKEWGNRKQFDIKTVDGIPINDEFRPFIEIYVEECIKIHGKSYAENPINCVDHILKEAKVFLMTTYLLWASMTFSRPGEDKNTPVNYSMMMGFCELSYKHYHQIKRQLKEQNIFDF